MHPDEQKVFFEREGYLVVRGLLSVGEIEACEAEIERLHRLAVNLEAKGDPAFRHFQREPYAKDAEIGDVPVLRKVEQTREFSEVFRALATHPDLVKVVQALIGPDLLLFRSTLMLKPAFHGSSHGLHQDSAYWPMDPPTLVTVSIALSDATSENGCICVIPKSHEWGLQEWGRIARDQDEALTDRTDVDLSAQVEVPLSAGDVLLFHSLLVHGSGPNRSANPRHTALYAYFPPTVKYVPGEGAPKEKVFPIVAGVNGKAELTLVAETGA
ncbi:MAG: phytanoyl-CoA dioxygenase family protein [bacterium]|nr:phytanoyl-CoA dioxygenase family protein [bacterium]